MADWRSRGYVPDSDDSEDDSQSLAPEAEPTVHNGSLEHQDGLAGPQKRLGTVPGTPSGAADSGGGDKKENSGLNETCDILGLYERETTGLPEKGGASSESHSISSENQESKVDGTEKSFTDISKPADDTVEIDELQQNDCTEAPSTRDIISHAPSQLDVSDKIPEHEQIHLDRKVKVVIEVASSTRSQQDTRAVRNLRHRNPIQLHPYAIESEKYRQVLKSRGLKPLRIDQTQNETQFSTAGDFRTLDPDVEEENQSWNPSVLPQNLVSTPSSPSSDNLSPSVFPTAHSKDRRAVSDVEFPDLNTLLRSYPTGVAPNGFKRRKTVHTFSQKNQRVPRKGEHGSSSGRRASFRDDEGLSFSDIPASPPPSSPSCRLEGGQRLPKFKIPRGVSPKALPTPLASSESRSYPVIVDSEGEHSACDINFPFEDEHSEASSDSPSEEQSSSQLQQVRRKIRGVLPASWIDLDRKSKITKPKPVSGYQRILSGGTEGFQRGIARRRFASKSKSPLARRASPIVLSDSEDSDPMPHSHNSSNSNLELAKAEPDFMEDGPEDDLCPIVDFGEVEEDNRIDPMLPTATRRYTATRKRASKVRGKPKKNTPSDHQPRRAAIHRGSDHQPTITHRYDRKRRKIPVLRPPKLSILDAPTLTGSARDSVPKFLKLALRTTRSRNDKGIQSPSKKYLKLATIKESEEINHTLEIWRNGTFPSRPAMSLKQSPREPLADRSDNNKQLPKPVTFESKAANPTKPSKARQRSSNVRPRKLQQTLDSLVAQSTIAQDSNLKVRRYKYVASDGGSKIFSRPGQIRSSIASLGCIRPAMLEGPQGSGEHQPAAFQQGLSRIANLSSSKPVHLKRPLTRKRPPRHLTPESVNERGPEAPFFEEAIPAEPGYVPLHGRNARTHGKGFTGPTEESHIPIPRSASPARTGKALAGLDQLGLNFSTFDLEPLPPGTVFEGTTFVGSGDFETYVKQTNFISMDQARGSQAISVYNNTIKIGVWNETAASKTEESFEIIRRSIKDPSTLSVSVSGNSDNAIHIAHGIMRYFSHHLSFADPVDRTAFLHFCASLVNQVSYDFVDSIQYNTPHEESKILLGTFVMVMAYQLSRIANHALVPSSLKAEISKLLASSARNTLRMIFPSRSLAFRACLNHLGLEVFQEAPSLHIQEECLPIQALVVSHHLLLESTGSLTVFWETINNCLPELDQPSLCNALVLEERWHHILSILPFLELDVQGKLEPERRHNIASENWAPIKQLINVVLDFYKANPTGQHPKFNAYCRKIYARCFNLIKGWGWGGSDFILGPLFDFFAQNQLEHLVNEEVFGNHGSPAFLDHLHEGPSIGPSREDRCFHILLKIIGEVLRQLRHPNDLRKAQNLVFRLMPNHGRYLPKGESIRQSALDALRNHHDLLCTLYWASPPKHRPRLGAFRDLVDMHSSHRQACHLNIRAWSRLVTFQLSTQEPVEYIEPFVEWHKNILESTLNQHDVARSEGEEEARKVGLANRNNCNRLDVSRRLLDLEPEMFHNENQIEHILADALTSLELAVKAAPHNVAASILIDESLTLAFRRLDFSRRQANTVVSKALDVLLAYTERSRAGAIHPRCQNLSEESQEFGDWSAFDDDDPLSDEVLKMLEGPLRALLSNCFGADTIPKDSLLTKVVDAYCSLASVLVQQGHKSWDDYLGSFGQGSWESLSNTPQSQRYRTYYLAKLLQLDRGVCSNYMEDLMKAWLVSIVEREATLKFQNVFTTAILNARPEGSLLRNPPFCVDGASGLFDVTPEDFSRGRLSLITTVLSNMWENVNETSLDSLGRGSMLKQQYKEWLKATMSAMKRNYQELGQGPTVGGAYVDFVHGVVQALHRNTSAICPVDRFFTDPGEFPLPATDPTYVIGQLQNYGLRLQDPRTPKQLAAFLQSLSEKAVKDDQQGDFSNKLYTVMSDSSECDTSIDPTLRSFLVKAILPAYLRVGFARVGGWVFLLPFLKALQGVFRTIFKDISANHQGSISSVASTVSSFLRHLWSSWRVCCRSTDCFAHRHVPHLLRECYLTVTALLPVLDYINRLGTPTADAMEILGFLKSFTASTMVPGGDCHDMADFGHYEVTVDAALAPVRAFAEEELEHSLKTFWSRKDARDWTRYPSAQRHSDVVEILKGLMSQEQEMERCVEAAREFLDCLEALPSFTSQVGRLSTDRKSLCLDEVMI